MGTDETLGRIERASFSDDEYVYSIQIQDGDKEVQVVAEDTNRDGVVDTVRPGLIGADGRPCDADEIAKNQDLFNQKAQELVNQFRSGLGEQMSYAARLFSGQVEGTKVENFRGPSWHSEDQRTKTVYDASGNTILTADAFDGHRYADQVEFKTADGTQVVLGSDSALRPIYNSLGLVVGVVQVDIGEGISGVRHYLNEHFKF
jgi:hypothetical protein